MNTAVGGGLCCWPFCCMDKLGATPSAVTSFCLTLDTAMSLTFFIYAMILVSQHPYVDLIKSLRRVYDTEGSL